MTIELIFEKFNKNLHDREGFDCGVEVLNEFIKTRSNKEMKQNLNQTYVASTNTSSRSLIKPIVGYYTLSTSALVYSSVEKEITRHVPSSYPIPTARIGRLARDLKYPGTGRPLLHDALYRIANLSKDVGIYGVQVDAKDASAKAFYKRYGFIELIDSSNSLFLPIKTLLDSL